ncbi:MAG TPA: DUF3106 domain-containing protein [Xanthomonadaceae bacterium]|nr:DUF3106 domain-containing protein [Xanthomonadaceae bacterium]
MRLDRAILLLTCALCLALPAALAAPAGWGTLDAGTQALLAPWQDDWDRLPTDQRERLLANARRWQAMDADARAALLKRDAQWQAMPPAERARLRARYAAWQALPADEQVRVRAAASRFASLPASQQGAVRTNFAAQDTGRQLAWLLGPSIGEWIDQADAWFAFVPDNERAATLRMLQDLPPDARTQLFALARRLPPDRREQLRRDLLLTAPAQRAALIDQRLAQ